MTPLHNRRRGLDIWPGFVDGLAGLLMVMVFVLLIFAIGQFFLSDALSGRDQALARLSAEVERLAEALSLEQGEAQRLRTSVGELSVSLDSTRGERDRLSVDLSRTQIRLTAREQELARLTGDIASLQALKQQLEAEVAQLATRLDSSEQERISRTELSEQALAQVELLNRQVAALRAQLTEISAALELARAGISERDLQLENLGRELNLALTQRVRELARYRSEFFGRLREALGERDDVRIVGDRFVFSSEVLFDSASDRLGEEGLLQLGRLAETLRELTAEIPADLDWVLQVDGHTDRRPISTARFPSNWELSTARAVAIVKFLRDRGIPPERLAATGYGEHHPLDSGGGEEALARNRRIELKLTSR